MITFKTGALGAAMIGAVAAVALAASWDAEREAGRALVEFGAEQATLARALAAVVRATAPADPRAAWVAADAVARPAETVVLVRRAGSGPSFVGVGGRPVVAPVLDQAFRALGASTRSSAHGTDVVRLGRPEAAALGLPSRTAWAGLARVDDGRQVRTESWEIAAVASAQRPRDRERAASRRLIGSVAGAVILVVLFGGFALREQRAELELARELAVATLQQSRDERLQRAARMAALGTLALGVAHEISTPLAVIAGRAEQLRPRADDERTQRGLDVILGQVTRINEVVRGLLGLARGDAPAGDRVAPAELADAAIGLVEHRFVKAGVPFDRQVAPGLPRMSGDARLLEHALCNLLLNACDACRAGGAVTLRAESGEAGGRREVVFTVADTGAGISAADVDRLVEPLFTTKPSGEGTGLGLAIAREIVSSHRGELALGPGPTGGTVVTVRLPTAAEDREDGEDGETRG